MTTTGDPVFEAVRGSVLEVLPELDAGDVSLDGTLTDLGANSVDRADVVTMSMERLGVTVPVYEFQGVHDIRSLVELLRRHV